MTWYIFAGLAVAVLAVTAVLLLTALITRRKAKRTVNILYVLFACCFFTAVFLCMPISLILNNAEEAGWLRALVDSTRRGIKMFGADEMYDLILDNSSLIPEKLREIYMYTALAVQLAAPLLTFGFIVSFLKNFIPLRVYRTLFWKEAHIFSELSEKSAALADSILKHNSSGFILKRIILRPLIVFTGVDRESAEENNRLLADARRMGAIVFKTDLETLNLRGRLWKRKLRFYVMGEDVAVGISHATHIVKQYDFTETSMYVFSSGIESELLLSAWDNKYMQVYRINDIQALVYHNLEKNGTRLFTNARNNNGGCISVVIAGLGKYGLEMLKALIWYCQMPGFTLKINIFDSDVLTEKRFTALCPEIMSKNRILTEGDAYYDITFHNGIDVRSSDFYRALEKIPDAGYIFVALGSDAENIAAAVSIRTAYERMAGSHPDIETVVFDSDTVREMSVRWSEGDTAESEEGILNHKKQAYNIHMTGDLESFYSVDTVIDSRLVARGLDVNLRWARLSDPKNTKEDEKRFWRYDYNYRSSIAKAIHEGLRKELISLGYIDPIPGTGKAWETLTEEEKLHIGRVEHVRWNAYMRSEGFAWGAERNDLAKLHHNLVPTGELSDDDLRKDA